jgi:hypothetical protein
MYPAVYSAMKVPYKPQESSHEALSVLQYEHSMNSNVNENSKTPSWQITFVEQDNSIRLYFVVITKLKVKPIQSLVPLSQKVVVYRCHML